MKRYIDADKLYADIAKDTYLLTDRINSRDYGMYLIGIKEKIADFSVRPSASDFCSYGIRREE